MRLAHTDPCHAAQYRANPEKYPDASLGKYLEGAKQKGLTEAEIVMDMHQAVCVGAFGGVTSVVSALCPRFLAVTCFYHQAPLEEIYPAFILLITNGYGHSVPDAHLTARLSTRTLFRGAQRHHSCMCCTHCLASYLPHTYL